jgi:hypothetical protein
MRNLLALLVVAGGFAVPGSTAAGTWTALANQAPGGVAIQMLLLLPDGTVMAQQYFNNNWYRLTPDIHGSYVNGTWTARASMIESRLFYSSVVLPGGKVFVAGGEYTSNGTQAGGRYSATAEMYDPVADSWSQVPAVPNTWIFRNAITPPPPAQPIPAIPFSFGDSSATVLADGNVLIGPVFGNRAFRSTIYDVANNSWLDGPVNFSISSVPPAATDDSGDQNEASWLKLRDGSILTVSKNSRASQRYIPATNSWIQDSVMPTSLYESLGSEVGAAVLQPDGKGFYIGASGTTAIYTPSGTTSPGTWAAGPLLPNVAQNVLDNNGNVTSTVTVAGAAPDAPACMMANGKILCALSGTLYNDARSGTNVSTYWANQTNPLFPAPTSFFEYDYVTQTFGPQINGPTGVTDNIVAYKGIMLALPDGKVLYSHYGSDLHVYDPGGPQLAADKPVITGISVNPDGTYHLTGTGLNGISCGGAYGDDAQMDSNYPLVRITSGANVYYARTYNWSSTGVQTGTLPVSTEFVIPPALSQGGGGSYSLVVVASGISSDPVAFPGEVWVDFNFPFNILSNGSQSLPFRTLAQGTSAVGNGGLIWVKPGATNEWVTNLGKPMTLRASAGPVTISQP